MILLLWGCITVDGVDANVDVALIEGDTTLLTIGSCAAWGRLQADFLVAADALDEDAAMALYDELPEDFWEFRIVEDRLLATHVLQRPTDLYSDAWVETHAGEGAAVEGGWEGLVDGENTVLSWGEAEPCPEADLVVERPLFSWY
jgi:hypothetical protein